MVEEGRQRIDKWLWFARVVKTRTLAQKLVAAGSVRVNRERSDSASRQIRAGDVLTISLPARVRVLRILAPGARRGPPAEAAMLYEDLSPPAPLKPAHTGREPGSGRPTKRDRRALQAFLAEDEDFS